MLAALALGLAMGVVIGGLGGGGGVLTIPALVYLLGQNARDATTSSLVIVGITAAVGTVARARDRAVDWRAGAALGIVGTPAAYLGTLLNRHVGQPVLLLAFAGLTLATAAAMLLDSRQHDGDTETDTATGTETGTDPGGPDPGASSGRRSRTGREPAGSTALATRTGNGTAHRLATAATYGACGVVVGFLTGFLGVGGGFLIVPALVVVLRMPMTTAVGTSLLLIVLNSVSSLTSRIGTLHLDWRVIAPFVLAAVLGTLLGKRGADTLSGATLTRAFAVLLVAVGVLVGIESIVSLGGG